MQSTWAGVVDSPFLSCCLLNLPKDVFFFSVQRCNAFIAYDYDNLMFSLPFCMLSRQGPVSEQKASNCKAVCLSLRNRYTILPYYAVHYWSTGDDRKLEHCITCL